MNLKRDFFSFQDLLNERPVLLDTCVLISPFNENGSRDFDKNFNLFFKNIERYPGRILVPKNVLGQYCSYGVDHRNKRNFLVEKLINCGGDVCFNNKCLDKYEEFYNKYLGFSKKFYIDSVDFDYAVSSLVLAKKKGPIFALTNDLELASFIIYSSKKEKLNRSRLCCLSRWDFNTFRDPFRW